MWKDFFQAEKLSGRTWTQSELEKWFADRGYYKIPNEEINCHECEGAGEFQIWMDIHEVLEKANIIG